MTDITIHNGGTLFQFEIHTDAARTWVADNVELEPYQWFGSNAFVVEHRYAADLAQGMITDGLEVD